MPNLVCALKHRDFQMTGCVNTLIQSIGIGGLKPNTLLLSWPINDSSADGAASMEYNTFIGARWRSAFYVVHTFFLAL